MNPAVNPFEDEAAGPEVRVVSSNGDAMLSVARIKGEEQRRLDEATEWECSLDVWGGRPRKGCPYQHVKVLCDLSSILSSACWEVAPIAGSPDFLMGQWASLQRSLEKAVSYGREESARLRNKFWEDITQG